MSEQYMNKFAPDHVSIISNKAHQTDRKCFICQEPIQRDDQAKEVRLDDALSIKVHPSCWSSLVQEMNEAEQQMRVDEGQRSAHKPAAMQANPRVQGHIPASSEARKAAIKPKHTTWVTTDVDGLMVLVEKGLLSPAQLVKMAENGQLRRVN
jgi:hypothetical protein